MTGFGRLMFKFGPDWDWVSSGLGWFGVGCSVWSMFSFCLDDFREAAHKKVWDGYTGTTSLFFPLFFFALWDTPER